MGVALSDHSDRVSQDDLFLRFSGIQTNEQTTAEVWHCQSGDGEYGFKAGQHRDTAVYTRQIFLNN